MTLSTLPLGWFSLKGHFTNYKPALIHYNIGTIIFYYIIFVFFLPFVTGQSFPGFFIVKISSDYVKFIISVLTYPFNYPHFLRAPIHIFVFCKTLFVEDLSLSLSAEHLPSESITFLPDIVALNSGHTLVWPKSICWEIETAKTDGYGHLGL